MAVKKLDNKNQSQSPAPQNGHFFETVGLMADKNAFAAIVPCKILHCGSPVHFFKDGLCRVPRWGVHPPSLSVHTHRALSHKFILFIVFTKFIYRGFFSRLCKDNPLPLRDRQGALIKSLKPGVRWRSGKVSLFHCTAAGGSSSLLQRVFASTVPGIFARAGQSAPPQHREPTAWTTASGGPAASTSCFKNHRLHVSQRSHQAWSGTAAHIRSNTGP